MAEMLMKGRWKSFGSLHGNAGSAPQSPFNWSARSFSTNSLSLSANHRNLDETLATTELANDLILRCRVAELLLDQNQNLLAAICQGTFVGEMATVIADCVIELLKQRSDSIFAEKFIKRVIRTKIYIYTSKRRKLTDLLRDNSMSTTLLTTYMRQTANEYLRAVLDEPLSRVLNEIIAKGISTKITVINETGQMQSPAENRKEDEARIIQACSILLDAVLGSRERMPRSLRQLCRFIKAEVEHISKYPPPFSVPDEVEEGLAVGPSPPSLQLSNSGGHVDSLSPPTGSNLKTPASSLSAKSTSSSLLSSPDRPSRPPPPPPAPKIAANISSPAIAVNFDYLQPLPGASLLPTMTNNHHPLRQQSSPLQQDSPLVLWERVVATFLFLRLIVPAVTAPESFGLCSSQTISNQSRRGLIGCGKVLNGLCSEMDFRVKEPTMTAAHAFIEQRRFEIRDYVSYLVSRPESAVATESSDNLNIQPNNNNSNNSAELIENASSSSLPSKEVPSAAWQLGRTAVDPRMAIHLARSLGRMEKDLTQIIRILPDVETHGVAEAFTRLKVELNDLAATLNGGDGSVDSRGSSPGVSRHSGTLLSRLAQRLSDSLFGSSTGSLSDRDLALSAAATPAQSPPPLRKRAAQPGKSAG